MSKTVGMGDMQHLEENTQVSYNTLHIYVIGCRKQLLGDTFDDEESFFIVETLLKNKCGNQMHALTVADIWVVHCECL